MFKFVQDLGSKERPQSIFYKCLFSLNGEYPVGIPKSWGIHCKMSYWQAYPVTSPFKQKDKLFQYKNISVN